MKEESIKILRHILNARIDNAESRDSCFMWRNVKNLLEYALEDNIEVLRQFDYLLTNEEKQE